MTCSAEKVCSIDDLLIKIFAGLPLGSLRLLKSVCKRWFSLITDPSFNSLRTDNPKGLLCQLQSPNSEFVYVPIDLNLNSNLQLNPPRLRFPFATNLEVWQSCNGLILCIDRPDKLYVYNPTINQCKLLPLPDVWMPKNSKFRLFTALAIAFDPRLSPHYKVIYAHQVPDRLVHVEIYSSETGVWRTCAQMFSLLKFLDIDRRTGVVYWRGAIHWLSRCGVYHFDTENPRFIHIEDHRAMYGITYVTYDKLMVSRGCLLLVRVLQRLREMYIYEMNNEHDYSAGWSVKYHVNLESVVVGPTNGFRVLSLVLGEREEDSFFVLQVTGGVLLRYNIISNTFHQLCDLTQIQLRDTLYYSFFFTPSLVAYV